MVTTVELQNPMEYSLGIILLATGLVLGAILIGVIIFLWIRHRNKKDEVAKVEKKPVKKEKQEKVDRRKKSRKSSGSKSSKPDNIPEAKRKYVDQIRDISNRYKAGAVSKRNGYQELSAVIRAFVNDYAGINTTYLTAAEVKAMGLGELYSLMDEYYIPDFAEDDRTDQKDLLKACEKAERVIKEWH